ncbi:hypothetical protein Tco_1090207 [Tanacetum coccineum]|uniref:Uncharacterized protein n=1 Tax=Tanacetum coccineum TaxID=301880 RepID=A0ABQ5I3J7_9ASTR
MTTLSNNSQIHNDIMITGSRERPPMRAPSHYAQWSSRFIRYVDTKSNKDQLRHCIEQGPYKLTKIVTKAVPPVGDEPGKPLRVEKETYTNTSPENRKLIDAEAEAIHMILNGIGESINKQYVKTKLFSEFGKFTSRDEESIESYYSRFYKMLNEMVQNKLKVDTVQIARNANPLALVAAAQHYPDNFSPDTYYHAPKPHKTNTSSSRHTTSTSSHATTKNKGKEIAKPITPPSESASKKDNDPEQAQRDKDMQKNLALIAKYIKNIYKPTNNNLKTLSNTRNKIVDSSPIFGNDRKTRQFGNQRTVTVAEARETVGNQEYRKLKWAKDYEYYKENMMLCKQESKGVLLSAEQDERLHDTDDEPDEQELEAHYMYMAKIQEIPTADSGPTYDAEPLEKVHPDNDYNVFATNKQYFEQPESINDTYVIETVDSNVTSDSSDVCDNEGTTDQNAKEPEDERVMLACLIANFKLDIDENKKSQKQLKKAYTFLI